MRIAYFVHTESIARENRISEAGASGFFEAERSITSMKMENESRGCFKFEFTFEKRKKENG